MAGYTRNDTSNNIADGNIINAADLDGEFDAIQSAFSVSTGHTHDGSTTGDGGPISKLGPSQQVEQTATAFLPATDNTIDLGSSSKEFKNLYIDGTANIDSLVADTADIDGGTIDGAVIGGSSEAAGSFTSVSASSTLAVTGAATLSSTAAITGNTTVGGTLGVTGAATLSSTADITGNTTVGGTLDVTGATTLSSTAAITGNATVGGTLGVTGAATLSSTAAISGNTTVGGTLGVTGAATLSSTIAVTGNATFGGNVTLGDAATDTVTVTADVASDLIPSADSTYKLGDSSNYWSYGYIDAIQTTGNIDIGGNLAVTGNLTINGTTTTVNSATVTVDDPIFTLGGDTAPGSDDNKDRGIEFRWHNGSAAKIGFFGFDDSTGRMTFIPDATNTSEVFSGTKGDLDIGSIYLGGTQVTSTAAEINLLDGATGGSVVNSKAVVYDGSGVVAATTVDLGNWTITESGGVLYFATGGTNKMKLDASGNLTVVGDVTAFGTV